MHWQMEEDVAVASWKAELVSIGSSFEIRAMMSGMAYASAIDNAEDFNELNDADFCHGCERKGAIGRVETGTLSFPMKAVFIDDDWTLNVLCIFRCDGW